MIERGNYPSLIKNEGAYRPSTSSFMREASTRSEQMMT